MSQNESFFDEVTEEVRRDRLFAVFRRWAWLAVLIVLVVVGLAAWNEWRKARDVARAQALGDAVVAALAEADAASRASALAAIEAEGAGRALVDQLAAAAAMEGEDGSALPEVAAAGDSVAPRWRDLAELKRVLAAAGSMPPEERISRLEPLTAPGAPYRLLALEQTAYARAEMGETEAALAVLRDVLADGEVTEGLRLRASQMIVALGGSPDPS